MAMNHMFSNIRLTTHVGITGIGSVILYNAFSKTQQSQMHSSLLSFQFHYE